MTYGYEEALARRAAGTTLSTAGGSGYFAQRGQTLDPALFEQLDHLRPDVRRLVLDTVYLFWQHQGYREPHQWAELWIAGSGITTAWDADREAGGAPGDLDVLIGVDYSTFARLHPSFAGSNAHDIAHLLNQQMFDQLWPHTDHTRIGNSVYELTYYINDGVGKGAFDIKVIAPYAAYDVTADEWIVHPVDVPNDFGPQYFSPEDQDIVARDHLDAVGAFAQYQQVLEALGETQDPARRLNHLRELHEAVERGASIYDRIHDGRKAAFGAGGKGYFDVANYRWQAGKGNGTITLTRGFKQLDEQAHRDLAQPCDDIGHLTLLAALANGRR